MKTYKSSNCLSNVLDINQMRNSNSFSFFENDKDKKLERNRESARNSRKRKKLYIEMLESKVYKKSFVF